MQRTKVIILSVLALLGFGLARRRRHHYMTSTSVKPVVTLRYYNINSGNNVMQSFPQHRSEFPDIEPGQQG